MAYSMVNQIEERKWAVGLGEQQYEREFTRRFPKADARPSLAKYLVSFPVEQRGIDAFSSEKLEIDYPSKKQNVPKVKWDKKGIHSAYERDNGMFECIGCGKQSTAFIGIVSHSRRCAGYLAKISG